MVSIAQGITYDGILKEGGVLKIDINKEMIDSMLFHNMNQISMHWEKNYVPHRLMNSMGVSRSSQQ